MIKSIVQVDYREFDRVTGNVEWSYFYRVTLVDGTSYETHSWHPDFAGHEITTIKA